MDRTKPTPIYAKYSLEDGSTEVGQSHQPISYFQLAKGETTADLLAKARSRNSLLQ